MFRPLIASVLALSSFACGGGAQPAAAPAPAPSAEPAPAVAAAPAPKTPSIEDQRGDFVNSCLPRTGSREYCDCAFEQFKIVFKDADFSKPLPEGDPRVAQLQEKSSTACAAKLPEPQVKASFVGGCVEGDQKKAPYCECAWTSLRKTLNYTEFVGQVALDDQRGVDARKTMAVDCKGKYPAESAKKDFMDACKEGKGSDAACTCRWGKILKQFSVEQVIAGVADVAAVKGLSDCK